VWKKLSFSVRYMLGQTVAGRLAPALEDAIFLVSFPKSGNTWIRFLIGNITHPQEPVTFANVDRVVPDIYVTPAREIRTMSPPRILKSHEPFDPRYRRVIYIVRDPRDVAVSSYHFARKGRHIKDTLALETYVSTLFVGRDHAYGNWGEHVASWLVNSANLSRLLHLPHPEKENGRELGARGHGRQFLLLRYEDLLENPEQELSKVSEFVGRKPSIQEIRKAIASSSVDKMKALEQKQSDQWSTTKRGRKDISFVREARSGQWKQSLPPASVATIESAWGHLMEVLGYERTTARQSTNSR
jgi:Sulfotransferase domain